MLMKKLFTWLLFGIFICFSLFVSAGYEKYEEYTANIKSINTSNILRLLWNKSYISKSLNSKSFKNRLAKESDSFEKKYKKNRMEFVDYSLWCWFLVAKDLFIEDNTKWSFDEIINNLFKSTKISELNIKDVAKDYLKDVAKNSLKQKNIFLPNMGTEVLLLWWNRKNIVSKFWWDYVPWNWPSIFRSSKVKPGFNHNLYKPLVVAWNMDEIEKEASFLCLPLLVNYIDDQLNENKVEGIVTKVKWTRLAELKLYFYTKFIDWNLHLWLKKEEIEKKIFNFSNIPSSENEFIDLWYIIDWKITNSNLHYIEFTNNNKSIEVLEILKLLEDKWFSNQIDNIIIDDINKYIIKGVSLRNLEMCRNTVNVLKLSNDYKIVKDSKWNLLIKKGRSCEKIRRNIIKELGYAEVDLVNVKNYPTPIYDEKKWLLIFSQDKKNTMNIDVRRMKAEHWNGVVSYLNEYFVDDIDARYKKKCEDSINSIDKDSSEYKENKRKYGSKIKWLSKEKLKSYYATFKSVVALKKCDSFTSIRKSLMLLIEYEIETREKIENIKKAKKTKEWEKTKNKINLHYWKKEKIIKEVQKVEVKGNETSCKIQQIDTYKYKRYGDMGDSRNYSLNWKSHAYIISKDWDFVLIKDWKELTRIAMRIGVAPKFKYSPDWKGFAYTTGKSTASILIKDWKEIEKYNHISQFAYSSDWKSFSFLAKKDWIYVLVRDWKEIEEFVKYDSIINFTYSPDLNGFVFMARKKWEPVLSIPTLVKDWKEIAKYDDIPQFIYSPDWKSFAYITKKDSDWDSILIKDWKEIAKYDDISQFAYSPDWKSFAFVAKKERRDREFILVKDWKEIAKYAYISKFIYSPDWKSFAYLVGILTEDLRIKTILIKDWKEVAKYDNISQFAYSPDWKKFVFMAAKDWKQHMFQQVCE